MRKSWQRWRYPCDHVKQFPVRDLEAETRIIVFNVAMVQENEIRKKKKKKKIALTFNSSSISESFRSKARRSRLSTSDMGLRLGVWWTKKKKSPYSI